METNIVIHSWVAKGDARLLVSWWNANTTYYHFKQLICKRHGNPLYNIIRYDNRNT
jgi:hypothetical protein